MTNIRNWPISAQIVGAAGVLGAIVTVANSVDAIADMQPLATKNYVLAANEETLNALTEQLSMVAKSIEGIRWDQIIYRQKALAESIPRMVTAISALELTIERDPTGPDVAARRAELRNLTESLNKNRAEFAVLTCQIENRGRAADCD